MKIRAWMKCPEEWETEDGRYRIVHEGKRKFILYKVITMSAKLPDLEAVYGKYFHTLEEAQEALERYLEPDP